MHQKEVTETYKAGEVAKALDNEQLRQSKRKLEVDLGRVRTVIGEKAFREIFEEKSKP